MSKGFHMNIKKIAEIANVSIATVSRVVNNKPGVRDEVRKKVEKIIRETEYRPNIMARGLVQMKSNVIGLLIPVFDGYYSERVEATLKVCADKNYGVMMATALENYERELENIKLLSEKHVEGIIYYFAKYTEGHKEVIERISKKTPVVLVDYAFDDLNIPAIIQDNYNGARKAMKYLIECGHRRIAFIAPPKYDTEAQRRYDAYIDTLKEENIEINDAYIKVGSYSINSGSEKMAAILKEPERLPTAVFAGNDNMAIGAINCIIAKGYRVPEDISVMGFDDIEIARHFNPALTTVHQDQSAVGREAAQLLLEYIENKKVRVKKIILDQELKIRDSVRKI
ncbi:MAG: LacI family transcriptional regulator [bacterium]|nr:LacI family transcriptional regulator [bacterium]